MDLSILILSILPVYLLNRYINSKDSEKEPKELLKKLTKGGIYAALLTIIISLFLPLISPALDATRTEVMNPVELLIYAFVGVALVEESCKYYFVHKYTYNNREFDYLFDMIVYATYVSLGFALLENLIYVITGGIYVGLLRAITAIPMHACTGVMMGHFLGEAKYNEINKKSAKKNKILALLVPILMHGAYDYSALSGHTLVFIILIITFIYISIDLVNKKSRNDIKIQRKYDYCPKCGTKIVGNFCTNCGKKAE